MDSLLHDLRYTARTLARTPGFTAAAVCTLALGIGAATGIFTLVNAVLLKPLAFPEPDRLVMAWEKTPPDGGRDRNFVSAANLVDWKAQSTSFEALAGFGGFRLSVTGGGQPEQIQAMAVSDGFFDILRTAPRLGRAFTPEDAMPGTPNVVVVSHGFWLRRLGGRADAVGRDISLNDEPATVVGVMPPGFALLEDRPDVWLPLPLNAESSGRWLRVVGRLKPGATLADARAEMEVIGRRLSELRPENNKGWSVNVLPLHEQAVGEVRTPLLVLLGAVGFLLLLACANVANLLLGRAAARQKEVAVRLSLGATRGRLARQMLTESLVLSGAGGALGVLLAIWGTRTLVAALPQGLALPRAEEVGVDARVLAFALVVSMATGLLFGLAPALAVSGADLQGRLRDGSRSATGGRRRSGVRSVLAVAEVALAVVLLAGAGLLVRSFLALQRVDTGLRTERVLTARVALPVARYGEIALRREFYGQLFERVRRLPGVTAAGSELWLPLTGDKSATGFAILGRPAPRPGDEPGADVRFIGGDYFRALGVRLLRGRTFTEADNETAPGVMVVNQAFVERFFPGEDPLGKRLSFEWLRVAGGDGEEYLAEGEIVGVVADVREMGPTAEAAPAIYRWYRQDPEQSSTLVVRTTRDPLDLASALRAEVRALDPNLPLADVRTMDAVAANAVARPRMNTLLLGIFAGAALLLAGLGLYAVISYGVAQRTREIGIRVALGAGRGEVLRLVVGQGARLTAAGLAIGLVLALVATRGLRSLLFGVSPTDPLTLAGISVFLLAVALLASWLPARRAAWVDPMEALRAE